MVGRLSPLDSSGNVSCARLVTNALWLPVGGTLLWTRHRRVQQNEGAPTEPPAGPATREETLDDDTSHATGGAAAPRRYHGGGRRCPRPRAARRPGPLLRHALAPLAGARWPRRPARYLDIPGFAPKLSLDPPFPGGFNLRTVTSAAQMRRGAGRDLASTSASSSPITCWAWPSCPTRTTPRRWPAPITAGWWRSGCTSRRSMAR